MANRFDVIVIGLGAMGSSAALHLARRGARVLGLDRFSIPHARGSSHGHTRMIRLCYYEHPDYVPLLHRAYELWADLERASGRRLLHITGGLYIGGEESEFVRGAERSAREHDLPHQMLSARDLAARFPMFRPPPGSIALYEPSAGALLPEAVIAAQAELALRAGAELHGHQEVIDWSASSVGSVPPIRVRTSRAEYAADRLVLAAGAWSDRVIGGLGVRLVVTRQVTGWVWPRRPELFELGRFPCWAVDHEPGSPFGPGTQHYGFPTIEGQPGFKIAHHFKGPASDPETIDLTPREADEADWRLALEALIPDGAGPTLAMRICMYTNSPDSHFIIDRHPDHPEVVLACGFSGHGFKFASVIGEVIADLALAGATQWPIDFLSLRRFKR